MEGSILDLLFFGLFGFGFVLTKGFFIKGIGYLCFLGGEILIFSLLFLCFPFWSGFLMFGMVFKPLWKLGWPRGFFFPKVDGFPFSPILYRLPINYRLDISPFIFRFWRLFFFVIKGDFDLLLIFYLLLSECKKDLGDSLRPLPTLFLDLDFDFDFEAIDWDRENPLDLVFDFDVTLEGD